MTEENKNHFIYRKHFPDSKSILNRKGKSIKELFKNALFVLDTNTLLVPFNTGQENIEEIGKIYKKLISENRLFIPEHVIREFAKNRSVKISDLFTNIDNQLSTIPSISLFEYPILGVLDAYQKLKESRNLITEGIKEYKKNLNELKSGIVDWNWSDPVTNMYQNTFSEKTIIKPTLKEEELILEYNQRITDEIAPGNKDKSKDNNAIGDFVIWKSILELGKEKNKDVIFVSNDEKNDWLLKGNKKSISTKFELVDEFYRFTDGHNFMSINFSSFLEYQGLEIDIVEIFKDFDRIFGTRSQHIKLNQTIKSLNEIENLISNFLFSADNIHEPFIDGYLDEHINNYLKNYRKEFFETDEWKDYFDYFFLFDEWLTEINSLNAEIVYQEYRMKRDTRTEFIKLRAISKEFLNKYTEFKMLL